MPVSPAVQLLENMLLDHPVASEISNSLAAQKILQFEKATDRRFIVVE